MLVPNLYSESKTPLYEQLYLNIKNEIENGNLKKNQKLPSKRNFSETLGVSINTITRAYNQLIDEGYIKSLERSGFYVENIENQLIISEREEENIKEDSIKEKDIKYNFSYNKVDYENYPFNIWRKLCNESIDEYDMDLLEMTNAKGLTQLRRCILNYIRDSRGVSTKVENIFISAGTEYLFQILFQILDEDSIFAVENPGYERLSTMFESSLKKYTSLPLDESGISFNELKNSKANVVCITPSHQFPMGIIMPIKRRMELLSWAEEDRNRYIIEDDYDSEFKYRGRPIPSLKSFDKNDKVIYMGSFSKSIAPSIRISYMVLPDELVNRFNEEMPFFQCCVPTLSQKILARFIEKGQFERHLNKMKRVYKKKREQVVSLLKELIPKCKIIGEEAGLHLILSINKETEEEDIIDSLKEKGIGITGISECYSDKRQRSSKEKMLILGYGGIPYEKIKPGINLLASELEKIK